MRNTLPHESDGSVRFSLSADKLMHLCSRFLAGFTDYSADEAGLDSLLGSISQRPCCCMGLTVLRFRRSGSLVVAWRSRTAGGSHGVEGPLAELTDVVRGRRQRGLRVGRV